MEGFHIVLHFFRGAQSFFLPGLQQLEYLGCVLTVVSAFFCGGQDDFLGIQFCHLPVQLQVPGIHVSLAQFLQHFAQSVGTFCRVAHIISGHFACLGILLS